MHSVSEKEQIWFIIQLSEPLYYNNVQKTRKKKGLGIKEELLANLFVKISAILIDSMVNGDLIEKLKNKHKIFVNASHLKIHHLLNSHYFNSDCNSSK